MRNRIEITPGACILWAFLLLVLPLRLMAASVTAALIHEFCHWLAICLCGERPDCVTIGAGGMVMETPPMEPGRELCCALAGPAGSFLLVLLYRLFPLLSLCALVQGCFNLLPVYPLDGGRALRCIVAIAKNTLQRWIFRSTIGEE